MRTASPTRVFVLSLSLWGCAAGLRSEARAAAPSEREARPLAPLDEAVAVWDSRKGAPLVLEELLDRLAPLDAVFLGETHLDDTTHRVELAVLEGLVARRSGRVVLSLEMFERDVQPALDDYLAGRIDEGAFLAAARPWKNYRADYRPLIEAAKRHGIPVVAANTPAALRRRVSGGGKATLDSLAPEERRLFPAEILPAEAGYWERVDRATRGHMDFASQPEEKRLYSGQNLWDNSMGAACAEALTAHTGSAVVHVVGGFHVMYGSGTAAQFRRRAPGATSAVVEILATPGLHAARPERDAERADYLVYATELARSLSSGTYAVAVPLELRYTLDLPPSTEGRRAPLVVWLADGGERPADARAFLAAALGAEAALAVVEPPLPELAEDLAPGGRWARASEFRSDQARLLHGIERLVEYVTRRLPVDGTRVVIAGRGSGATAALWSALYTEWLDAHFVAVAPRGAHALQLEGLPERAPLTRALTLLTEPGTEEELAWLRSDYEGLGVPIALAPLGDGRARASRLEAVLRDALALPAITEGTEELCVLERDLPRARQWAEAFARRLGPAARVITESELRGDEDPARVHRLRIGGEWPLASFVQGRGLPLAEGDFGGTTVLVVPAAAGPGERDAWLELERAKALKARSPFAGLRVALAEGEPTLAQVLDELARSGARSVLVVPATFCAASSELQALRGSLDERVRRGDAFDLAWLPGLGAELCQPEQKGP